MTLGMTGSGHTDVLASVLADFVVGKNVKRAKLYLVWEGKDVSAEFISALTAQGYFPVTVADMEVEPGKRIPAFALRDGHAWFGWVFWEKFTDLKMRKLFGSVVRNAKGDWALQITPKMPEQVYANRALMTDMDIDRPQVI